MILARSWPPSWPHRRPGNLLFTRDEPPYSEPGEGGHGQREPKQQSPPALPEAAAFPGHGGIRGLPGSARWCLLSAACEAAF